MIWQMYVFLLLINIVHSYKTHLQVPPAHVDEQPSSFPSEDSASEHMDTLSRVPSPSPQMPFTLAALDQHSGYDQVRLYLHLNFISS